jgi:hypothetical protein
MSLTRDLATPVHNAKRIQLEGESQRKLRAD